MDSSYRSGRGPERRARGTDDPLAACARALADVAGAATDDARLAGRPDDDPDAPRSVAARGLADTGALHRARHDPALQAARRPREAIPAALFAALERERVEAPGANRWAGVAANLDLLRAESSATSGADPLARVMASVVARVRATLVPSAAAAGPASVVGDVEARAATVVAEYLPALGAAVDDQAAFADQALAMIRRLGLVTGPGGGSGGAVDEAGDGSGADVDADDAKAVEGDDEPLDDEETSADEPAAQVSDEVDERPTDGDGEADTDLEAATGDARDEPPVAGVDPRVASIAREAGYRVFTGAFDEVVDARTLADAETLTMRRAELDRHLERQGRLVRRLATRLQKVLLARQRREWQYDLDDGQLDTRRLYRLVSDPLTAAVFKGEVESAFRDTTVTLLIDNSRSMIGRPIMIAAACADILARTLERCGVAVEVLGFTTVDLHGGRSAEAWEAAGRPASPGRLNDVRHIVYKSADVPYRSARRGLALMLERDLLKQNIDGEALQWAASRLMRRPSERRILLVISDGAPVDTATLTANSHDYLDRHLDAVVADLERRGTIELAAIGIGHDVARFYSQAMSVFDARGLGPALLSRLESLFRRAG